MFFIFLPVIKRSLLFPTAGSQNRYSNGLKHRYSDWISTVYCVMYLNGVQLNSDVHLKIRWIQEQFKATTLFIPHEKRTNAMYFIDFMEPIRRPNSIQFDQLHFYRQKLIRWENKTKLISKLIKQNLLIHVALQPKCLIFCCTINQMLEIAFTVCIIANVPLLQSPTHNAHRRINFYIF